MSSLCADERDLFWEKAMAAIEPTKEQRSHLVYFSLGGRASLFVRPRLLSLSRALTDARYRRPQAAT